MWCAPSGWRGEGGGRTVDHKLILQVLNTLSMNLTLHSHRWTNEERELYDRACAQLKTAIKQEERAAP